MTSDFPKEAPGVTVKADAVRLVKPGILEEWMAVLPAPATPLSTAFWSASGNVRSSFAEAFHRAGGGPGVLPGDCGLDCLGSMGFAAIGAS